MFKIGDNAMATGTFYDPYTFSIVARKDNIYAVKKIHSKYYIEIENYDYKISTCYFINYTRLERKLKIEKINENNTTEAK